VQFGSDGHVKVMVRRNNSTVLMSVTIEEGWHINAHNLKTDELIGTDIVLSDFVTSARFPEGVETAVSFSDSIVSLYEGSLEIEIETAGESPCQLMLRFQACNDSICLSPEHLVFYC
jgi:hypothetical protein